MTLFKPPDSAMPGESLDFSGTKASKFPFCLFKPPWMGFFVGSHQGSLEQREGASLEPSCPWTQVRLTSALGLSSTLAFHMVIYIYNFYTVAFNTEGSENVKLLAACWASFNPFHPVVPQATSITVVGSKGQLGATVCACRRPWWCEQPGQSICSLCASVSTP